MPIERFWWSPDGERAVVVLDQVPHLVNGQGQILEKLSLDDERASKTLIDGTEWLPDGKQFIAHRVRAFESWEDARANLPETEVAEIERLAKGVPEVLKAAVLVGGDSERPDGLLKRISGANQDFLRNAFLLALETQPEKVRDSLKNAPTSLAALEEQREEFEQFLVHDIVLIDLSDSENGAPEVILQTSEAIQSPTISPKGTAVAYAKKQENQNLFTIEVCPFEKGRSTVVVADAHDSIAWTEDGRSIVYMAPVANDGILKQIKKVTVFDGDGNLLNSKSRPITNLATAVVPFAPRIERLPGDEILFASQSGSVPVATSETPYEASLYRVSAKGGPIVRIPTSPGALPMNLGFFIASPDGERVAVVESDTDAVAVVEIETGRTELVSPAHDGWQCRTIPAWKSSDELTFAALDPDSGEIHWKSWSRTEENGVLSESWPEDSTADWLEKKKDER